MSLRSKPLDDRQLAVLRWVGDGCPDGPLAVPANKNRAQALANPGLVEVKRGKPGWRAVLTEAGRFYQNHAVKPVELDREGPMLISLADAARATGISYSQLGDIAGKGSIEQVRVGSRRYLKRKSLLDFIERNIYRGWAY